MISSRDDVRRYYDANTARFVRFGQGGTSIHRALWGPGVETREQAMHYVDDRILDELTELTELDAREPCDPVDSAPNVLDLGCGVGATLLYLAERANIRGLGLTISGVQAAHARQLIDQAGLTARLQCREGDFLALDLELQSVDLAFSIEAFIHSSDPGQYFREVSRVLRPGGRLFVCDDFLTHESPRSDCEQGWLTDFREGWRAPSVVSVSRAKELAARAGFRSLRELDFTPYLELGRPRDHLIGLLVTVSRKLRFRSEYWRALRGGDALQRALRSGVLSYRALVFER